MEIQGLIAWDIINFWDFIALQGHNRCMPLIEKLYQLPGKSFQIIAMLKFIY